MATFSERMGIKPVKTAIQVDSMDDALRNKLWSALLIHYWHVAALFLTDDEIADLMLESDAFAAVHEHYRSVAENNFLVEVWDEYFKKPLDDKPENWQEAQSVIRELFFACPWHEVYDFIEFVANTYDDYETNRAFIARCNTILTEEMAGYRFVGSQIAPITSEQEIAAIEQALAVGQTSTALNLVSNHLRRALELFSDRQNPDYRNSVKESISAVEAICKLIGGTPDATLGQALKAIAKGNIVALHPSLKDGFQVLYGYTSDAAGIRHAMKDASTVDQEDALFMLVSCSAFVNYLVAKATKAGITL